MGDVVGFGLSHPRPRTQAYNHLLDDLRHELLSLGPCADTESMKRLYGRRILAFMIARDCWQMGTRVEVHDDFSVSTSFPAYDLRRGATG